MQVRGNLLVIPLVLLATTEAQEPQEGDRTVPFEFSVTQSSLGTTETETIGIAGVPVTFPVDESDTVEALKPLLELWIEKRAVSAAKEAEGLAQVFRDPEIHELVKKNVRHLLGEDPLSAEADEVLAKGAAEIAGLAGRWKVWSGRPSAIRLHNQATMAPHRDGAKVSFESITYEGVDGTMRIRLDVPLITARMGIETLAPPASELRGLAIDLPIFAPPGTGADPIATELGKMLLEIQRMLNSSISKETAENLMHYLAETLLVHEIGGRFLADPPSPVVSRALARIYLVALVKPKAPSDEIALRALLGRLFAIEAPESPEARKSFASQLADLDLFGEVPPDLEDEAARLLAFAIFQASQNDPRDQAPLQLFRSEGIGTPPGGFDQGALRSALERAYPGWPGPLETVKAELLLSLRQSAANRKEDETIAYPSDYETTTFDGFTFRHPPAVKAAVDRIGPQWAGDWRRAREVIERRFGGPWHKVVEMTDEDFASLGRYGIEPVREEAELYAMMTMMAANVEKWLVHLISGKEAGLWFRDDLEAALGTQGRFGGFRFDFEERSAAFETPFGRGTMERGAVDPSKLLEQAPEVVFPVLLVRAEIEGKTVEEQIAALEKRDVFLRDLCRAADTIGPEVLGGREPAPLLSDAQAFFIMVHEAIEAALVRQVIGSPDRRWFCDGFANLVAIRECERRFGEGMGWATFESLFDPERSRALRDQVDLLAWSATDDEKADLAKIEGVPAAHYYFATLAVAEAVEGRGEAFLRDWIAEIRKNPWNRTNAATVIDAYERLAGVPLRPHLENPTTTR